jgi:hypothetical protein
MQPFRDTFAQGTGTHWQRQETGGGALLAHPEGLLLCRNGALADTYCNAQIDDYQGLPRRRLPWRPPLRLDVMARFSHPCGVLAGTAGFGFWNNPFFTGRSLPSLPRAAWFFYASPPSDMRLDTLAPGWGWKAATIDAWRPGFLALAPTAPLALPLLRYAPLRRALWPIGQVALGVREMPLTASMTDWQRYSLIWRRQGVRFLINDQLVLDSPFSPAGPLGLVIWLDNQYAIVTMEGRFGGGLVAAPGEQWLQIAEVALTPL